MATGSEIEIVLFHCFSLGFGGDREPSNLDLAGVLTEFVPLSKLMAEQSNVLRCWALGSEIGHFVGADRGETEGHWGVMEGKGCSLLHFGLAMDSSSFR